MTDDPERSAPPIDPAIAPLLARLAAIATEGDGPDVTRSEADRLTEQDLLVQQLQVLAGVAPAVEPDTSSADVARLSAAALDPVHGHASLGALRGAIATRLKVLGVVDERRVPTLAERLLARLERPALVHVPTSLPTLDAATRGGLLLRRVHVIGGEPDAGKTALLVQILLHAARAGYAVAIYAVDEPGEGIEDRIGQSFGLALDDLEANVQKAILWLAEAVRDLPNVLLIEQGEDGFMTIEDAADALLAHAKRHGCRGAVLGVDSLQTAHCRAFHVERNAPRTAFERAEAMTVALKAQAKRGLGVLATSELNRGAYDQKPGRRPPSPMAAFKNSGSIEYTMTVGMLVTRIAKGEHAGDILLQLPKNKRGEPGYRGVKVRLERDPDRCTFTDRGRLEGSSVDDDGSAPVKDEPRPDALESYCERVRQKLAGHPNGFAGNRADLALLVGGKAARTRAAIALMFSPARGELVVEGKKIKLAPRPPNDAKQADR